MATETSKAALDNKAEDSVLLSNPQGRSSVIFVCEHATNHVPASYHGLGLPAETLAGQLAWDFGALGLAEQLQRYFDAALVSAAASRLVCDVSRAPDSAQVIAARSHGRFIPGNYALSEAARTLRLATWHEPFERAVSALIEQRLHEGIRPVLVSVHSFVPRLGDCRGSDETEILAVHDADDRLARHLDARCQGGAHPLRRLDLSGDDATWTLRRHALPLDLFNLRVAVQARLLDGHRRQQAIAQWLGPRIAAAIDDCRTGNPSGEDH